MAYTEAQVREIFFEEMREILENVDSSLVALESNTSDTETIRKLFREVHTLKGSSGVFGLKEIADLAHHGEDLLVKIRDNILTVDENIISILLACFDSIRTMIESARKGEDLGAFDNSALVKNIEVVKGGKGVAEPPAKVKETVVQQELEYLITVKNCAQFFLRGLRPSTFVLNCKDLAVSDQFHLNTTLGNIPRLSLLKAEECYCEFSFELTSAQPRSEIEGVFEFASEIGTVSVTNKKLPEKAQTIDSPVALPKVDTPITKDDFLKVKSERVDHLLNLVGELITLKSFFAHLTRRMDVEVPGSEMARLMREGSGNIKRISSQLQDSVMNVRMVPIGTVFGKYSRLVRDTSKALGKKVSLKIEGEDTEVDKTVADAISDPLMHLIRNSLDHGIESAEKRKQRGKDEAGTVVLRAGYEGSVVKISIIDDGGGIDHTRIAEIALAKGLTTSEHLASMSESEILDFIFQSGFSTAAVVSDVSGRGVGMDVVRSNVRKAGGTIAIKTQVGIGTEFCLSLPLSLAVIEALLVGCGSETYALPQECVVETVLLEASAVSQINKQRSMNLRNEILPIINLASFIGVKPSVIDEYMVRLRSQREESSTYIDPNFISIVVANVGGVKVGIEVDNLFWQEQVMVKPVEGFLAHIPLYAGACIMGNGDVVMVIEPKELYAHARQAERTLVQPQGMVV